MSEEYKKLGASSSKEGVHLALKRAGLDDKPKYFSNVNKDIAGDPTYCSFLHCDGAGTKSIVAYLSHKKTGKLSAFKGLAQDALAMNLDDVFCVGTPTSLALGNLIARNAGKISDEVIAEILISYTSLIKKFSLLGIEIDVCGGETADCGDLVRTILVDAVLTGRIPKANLISTENIAPGDIIIGLSSTGKTTYEEEVNSGISSNGLTLARHALLSKEHMLNCPEVVDPGLNVEDAYRGLYQVDDYVAELGMSVGDALLSPTRCYAPVLKELYSQIQNGISAVIHLTGGGQTKVLKFGNGLKYIKNSLFAVPPLFSLIQKSGNIPWREMYQVFNMGHRMEIYAKPEHLGKICSISKAFSLDAKQIGYVEKSISGGNTLSLHTEFGEFTF